MVLMIYVRRLFSALIGSIGHLLWITLALRCHVLAKWECGGDVVPVSVNSQYCQGPRAFEQCCGPLRRSLQNTVWSVSLHR